MVWDFSTNRASAWYNRTLLGSVPISNITILTGWSVSLQHDSATGTGTDTVWIDNVAIDVVPVPEPGSLLALGIGLAGLVGTAINRRG